MYTLHIYIAAVPLMRSTFGMGTGMIVEQISCCGTERQLVNCTIRDVPDGECNHNEDAGVRCGKCHDDNNLLNLGILCCMQPVGMVIYAFSA